MSDGIAQALSELKTDMRDGFKDTNRRIDALVTQGQLDAVVARLDQSDKSNESAISQVRADLADHEAQTPVLLGQIRSELHSSLSGFRKTAWTVLGIAVAAAGVLATVLINIVK